MAFLQIELMSKSLMRIVPVNVLLPIDKNTAAGEAAAEEKPFRTLYLLHGIFGNRTSWVNRSRILAYADEHDLAVVMPSGDNAFYVDQPAMNNFYGEFIGRELVELTRRLLPLSRKREDTYIGGLSMGGYGAMRNGLKYSDTFSRIIALSGALLVEEMAQRRDDEGQFPNKKSYAEALFGDLTRLVGSDADPKHLVRELKRVGKPVPKIYMACGVSDGLLDVNRDMYRFLEGEGVDVTYEEGPGAHEWDFWDEYIKKGIEWLPEE